MSILKAESIFKSDGVTKHNRVGIPQGTMTQIGGDITWHTSYNGTTQVLGNISGASGSDVYAIGIAVFYQHNGSTNHGYLAAWYHQTGKTSNQGMQDLQAHYDWYFNYDITPLIIPWDPTGTQSLSIAVSSAYNTSANNTYRIYYTGIYTQD